jgi:hypothetical protein
MWRGRILGVEGVIVSLLAVCSAHADEAPPKSGGFGGQHNFGIGAQLGLYQPNGFALRIGAREFAIEVAGGYMLQVLAYTWQ